MRREAALHLAMAKKNRTYDFYDDDDIVMDKKTKRRMERAKSRENQQRAEVEAVREDDSGDDTMSRIALLCQENRWREAVLVAREALAAANKEGREDDALPLSMVMEKLEMSLRRQMAAAFLSKAEIMLKKECLPDVGE